MSGGGPAGRARDHDDEEAIRRLTYAYFRCLDLKRWDELASLLVPRATGACAGLDLPSREDLVAHLRESLPDDRVTLHLGHHPEITVDGDAAEGTWYVHDKVFVPGQDLASEGAAFYRDRYVRTPEGWRLSHVGHERTFEASWQTSAVPGWTFERGRAYDA